MESESARQERPVRLLRELWKVGDKFLAGVLLAPFMPLAALLHDSKGKDCLGKTNEVLIGIVLLPIFPLVALVEPHNPGVRGVFTEIYGPALREWIGQRGDCHRNVASRQESQVERGNPR